MLNKIVFAFGSKTVHDLKDNMKKYIDLLIWENVQFVIGDCDGADTAIQQYLADKEYKNVLIYASYNPVMDDTKKCRNNVGNWNVCHIETDYPSDTYEYRRAKDIAMINICNEAFCIWDNVSKGIKKNIEEVAAKGKNVGFMIDFDALLSNIKSIDAIHIVDDAKALTVFSEDPVYEE